MKIIQLNCVYAVGSTGKITRDLHTQLLAAGHESLVLYGRGAIVREPGVRRIGGDWYGKANRLRAWLTGWAYGGCSLSTACIKRVIRKERPDLVHLQCVNGDFCNLFRLLSFLKISGIPTVMTLHAEFLFTGGCHSPLLWDRSAMAQARLREIYAGWQGLTLVGPSRWICSRAARSGILDHVPIRIIPNGIDNQTVFYPRPESAALREALGVRPGERAVLFAAPDFSELKGFDYYVALAEACRDQSIRFFAVGKGRAKTPDSVQILGWISDQHRLAELYTAADALVVCSRQDNYPTVCLEAASCGTPVVGFDVGGVREAIPPGMGQVVPFGDVPALREALLQVTERRPRLEEASRTRCSREEMAAHYLALYWEILREG